MTSVFAVLIPLAWLLPNHYLPWVSAWSDGLSLLCLSLGLIANRRLAVTSVLPAIGAFAAVVVIGVQAALGLIYFAGDALMAALYLSAFLAAISLGSGLVNGSFANQRSALDTLALTVCLCAIASVGIAVVQWTGVFSLGLWGAEMPPGGRPYGNVAQPNHLSTICFLGICSLALLHERRRIGITGVAAGVLWLLLGMATTSSRTGWLQIAALMLAVTALHKRSRLKLGLLPVLTAVVVYTAMVAVWPAVYEATTQSVGRSAQEFSSGGTRPLHWTAMLAAIQQEPWFGYGWQQVSVAQVRTADIGPHVGEHIEHSHNLFLDLLVWNGVPIGLLLSGILIWWFVSRWTRCCDGAVFWLMVGITGLGAHAMVEYPLSFAYFLIPLGFWIGAVDAMQGNRSVAILPRWTQVMGVVLAALLIWVAADYLKAEHSHRLLRLEAARIGSTGLSTPPPQLQLLTQLEAFQRFAHSQARVGMSADELDQMRKVSERFAYPPSLFRYALAQGLNGQAEGAALTLLRLCRIHPQVRCDEGRDAWANLQQRHAQLQSIVYPLSPDTAVLK